MGWWLMHQLANEVHENQARFVATVCFRIKFTVLPPSFYSISFQSGFLLHSIMIYEGRQIDVWQRKLRWAPQGPEVHSWFHIMTNHAPVLISAYPHADGQTETRAIPSDLTYGGCHKSDRPTGNLTHWLWTSCDRWSQTLRLGKLQVSKTQSSWVRAPITFHMSTRCNL